MSKLVDRARTPGAALLLCLIVLPTLLLMSCGRTKTGAGTSNRPDPLWGKLLESHTTGVISRGSDVRVIFAADVVPADRVGKPAESLKFEPPVEGSVTFVSRRELVFTPRKELAAGTLYKITVSPRGLLEMPQKITPFEFAVQVPQATTLSVPFEAVGVRSVRVTAFRICDDNVTQFLQVNPLNGSNELGRVGRHLWRKTIALNATNLGRWNRYNLDVTELMKKYPGGLLRLTVSIGREDLASACPGVTSSTKPEPLAEQEANDVTDSSNWDYVEDYYNIEDGSQWADRDNPCKDYYYASGQSTKTALNLLLSNLGLLAKKDQGGHWLVVASDLRTRLTTNGRWTFHRDRT